MDKVVPPGETSNERRILIVDDDNDIISFLCDFFLENGYSAVGYTSAKKAMTALKKQKFDLLFTDLMMPEMDGIELLKYALKTDPSLVVIIMTGYGTIRTAIQAKKAGAFEYILKPFKSSELQKTVSRAMEAHRLLKSEKE